MGYIPLLVIWSLIKDGLNTVSQHNKSPGGEISGLFHKLTNDIMVLLPMFLPHHRQAISFGSDLFLHSHQMARSSLDFPTISYIFYWTEMCLRPISNVTTVDRNGIYQLPIGVDD
jgi:hypothetical protein